MTTGIKINGKELTAIEVIEMGKNNLKRLHKIIYKTGSDLDEINGNKDLIKRMETKIKIQEIENKMSRFCSNKEYNKLEKKLAKLKG